MKSVPISHPAKEFGRVDGVDAMDDAIQQQGQALEPQARPAAFSMDFGAEADAYLDGWDRLR